MKCEQLLDINKIEQESLYVVRDQYTDVYPHLISYFKEKSILAAEDFIRGAHMVYAWMPTILTVYSTDLDEVVSLINKAKNEGNLQEDEIETIATVVNNSVVGTSKLLHFIAPEHFPIWDSRVYFYLTKKRGYNSKVNNVRQYLEYMALVNQIIKKDKFKIIHDTVNLKLGYDVSAVRAIEIIMFQSAKN